MKSSKRRPAYDPSVIERRMLRALLRQKGKYEKYLKSRKSDDEKDKEEGKEKEATGLDHKAEHAYTHIIKTIIEISRKSGIAGETDPEEFRLKAKEILENDYGIKRD